MRYSEFSDRTAGFEIVDPSSCRSTDDPDGFYYHVTSRPKTVLKSGLRPNQKATMGNGFYRTYSAGKVFFCERPGVHYWLWTIGNHLEAQYDRSPKLSVVRFPKTLVTNPLPDEIGTRDSREPSYYVTEPITSVNRTPRR